MGSVGVILNYGSCYTMGLELQVMEEFQAGDKIARRTFGLRGITRHQPALYVRVGQGEELFKRVQIGLVHAPQLGLGKASQQPVHLFGSTVPRPVVSTAAADI